MPLNSLQLETISTTITMCADKVDRLKKIGWLQLSINDTKLTIEEAVQVLKQHPALTKGLTNVNVPNAIRGYWRKLMLLMGDNQSIPGDLLKELSEFNNYNPLLMAEMRLFEDKINAVPELSVIKNELLCLREAYLEMTPLVSSSYGGHSRTVCFRLGQVPFNLDKLGSLPLKGEVQKEIKKLIGDRLKPANKDQKEIDEKDKKEGKVALAFKETEKILGTHALLGKMTEQQRHDLFKQQESSTKHDRLFQMQHVLLNNRITDMMHQATANLSKVNMTLKQSKTFLELRVAECCKVLVDVQWSIIEEYCNNEADFNAGDINDCYQTQLQVSYEMYLDDMVTKWMLDRKPWLSDDHGGPLTDAAFAALSGQFKQDIQNAMKTELKGFQSFKVESFSKVGKLRPQLQARKTQQSEKAEQCKKKWDEAAMPLADLADKCNELRGLRSQIQQNECNVAVFNQIVTALSKIRHGLGVSETDQGGFNLLHYACWGGNLKLVQELLAQGVPAVLNDSEGNYILHLAVENESAATPEVLETLMKQPLFINTSSVLELKNKRRKTPLHVAAAFGNVTAVQWIVGKSQKAKALELLDLELEADGRMTPLHYAAREGQEEVVNFLLTFGAGRSMKVADNNHPLIFAIKHGRLGVAHLFFKRGIWLNPEQTDHVHKMAKGSDASSNSKIAYCLAVPVIEGLNNLARLPRVTAVDSRPMTAAPSTPVAVAGDRNASSTPRQPIAEPLVSVLAAAHAEPSAERVEQSGQDLFFGTRGRAVAAALMPAITANANVPTVDATPSVNVDATFANARTTATATL